MLAASVSGVAATAVEAKPATSAADAVEAVPTSSTTSIENATPALSIERTMLPERSETATPQASTEAPAPSSTISASFLTPVDVQLTPAPSAESQQAEGPHTTVAPQQRASSLAGNCQQPNAGSTDSASTNTTPAPSATTPNTVRNSDQHIVPFVFAQGAAQLLKPATPAAPDAAPTSNGDSTKQAPAADAVTTVQPPGSDSAQTSTLKAALASAAQYPAVKLLPDLNAGNATTVAVGTSENGNQIKGSDSGNEKNPSDASTTTKGSSSQNGTPTPSAQSGGTTQHAQPDAAQISAMTAKVADASPLQTAPVHVAAQQQPIISGATDRQPHSAEIAGSTLPAAADGPETAGTSGVNTAKLIQTLSETQMQVGMHSAEFGDISIRTAVSEQQMVAQITVDHGDLGRAIALHAPAAQIKLGDDLGVRAAIQVTQSGMSFSHEHGSAAQQEQRSFARPVEALDPVSPAETESTIPRAALAASETDRLDIRA